MVNDRVNGMVNDLVNDLANHRSHFISLLIKSSNLRITIPVA